jgi:hypothetical protein
VNGLNLFTASPADIRELMQETADVATLRLLADLEAAASAGDEEARVDAIDGLFDLMTLRHGVGL